MREALDLRLTLLGDRLAVADEGKRMDRRQGWLSWIGMLSLGLASVGCGNALGDPSYFPAHPSKVPCQPPTPTQTVKVHGKASLAPALILRQWSGILSRICGKADGFGITIENIPLSFFSIDRDGSFELQFKADCLAGFYGGGIYSVAINFEAMDSVQALNGGFFYTTRDFPLDDASCQAGEWNLVAALEDPRRP